MMLKKSACLLMLLCGAAVAAASEGSLESPLDDSLDAAGAKVVIDLVPAVSFAAPGASFDLLVRQKIAPGWHTYWRNPGDSGAPLELNWTLPPGVEVSDFEWPLPERIPFGPLMNFGYHDQVLLPMKVTLPADFDAAVLRLEAAGRILVCADICIPQQVHAEALVAVASLEQGGQQLNPKVQSLFREAREQIPVQLDLPASYALQSSPMLRLPGTDEAHDQRLRLMISLPVAREYFAREHRISQVTYFPYIQDLIDNTATQAYAINETGLVIDLTPGYLFEPETADLSGLVVIEEVVTGNTATQEKQGRIVSGFKLNISSRSAPGLSGLSHSMSTSMPTASSDMSLLLALAFAFLGGLILNLMPCVFPILSIKILSLMDTVQHQGSSMTFHGLTYSAGVLLSFIAIAALLIALRLSGEVIGWGFQLQSPLVVGFLAYLFVLIGLNLFGYFEIGGWLSLGTTGASASGGWQGYGASFGTGILATLVAAPCTAPFMGAAVGFALTQPPPVSLLIFASLGAGMALPYLLLCMSPGLLRWLPRPGVWMLKLKHLLAFPMFASALWLLWVLGIQVGLDGLLQVLVGLLMLSFAVWLLSQSIRSRLLNGGVKLLGSLVLLGAGYLVVSLDTGREGRLAGPQASPALEADDECLVYSPTALAKAREAGDLLVNFTAAWCITCKVNELTTLNTRRVQDALREHQVACMRADWTNEDPVITAALQEYGRSGVPLYLFYRQGEARAEVLPQILTPDLLLEVLNSR